MTQQGTPETYCKENENLNNVYLLLRNVLIDKI